MGIQVAVSMEEIKKAGWNVRTETYQRIGSDCGGWECHYCGGNYDACTEDCHVLVVEVPGIGWVESYLDDALVFDNKTANMNIRQALDDHNVQYVRG